MEDQDSLRRVEEALTHISYLMHQLTRRYLLGRGLNMPRFWVLSHVGYMGGATMGDLQRQMGMPPSTLTGLVDALVADGLLDRERDEEDRRVVRLALTGEGRRLLQETFAFRQRTLREAAARLTPEQQAVLLQALEQIHARLRLAHGCPEVGPGGKGQQRETERRD